LRSILIRADGSKKLGMGHLNRCYLIASYLENEYNINSVLLVKDSKEARLFLSKKQQILNIVFFESMGQYKYEFDTIINLIDDVGFNLILFDLLEVESESVYLDFLSKINIPKCVISDDSHYHEFPADLIINGNPNQSQSKYLKLKQKYLIGPEYFIMDSDHSKSKIKYNNLRSVLVSLGGSDHNDIIFTVIQSVIEFNDVDKVIVVSSRSSGYVKKLKEIAIHDKIELHFDVESLSGLWSECSVAITAGGNTLFERIAAGVPGGTVCQLSRQMEIANSFESRGVNVNFGFGPDLTANELSASIDKFLKDKLCHSMQRRLSKLVVPGNGLKICAKQIVNLI